jgi:hypothetical protein
MELIHLTHSREDEAIADDIARAITGAGFTVVLDSSELQIANADFRQKAPVASFIVLWSRGLSQSLLLQEAIGKAIEAWSLGRLVLAVLDDTPLPLGLNDLSPIALQSRPDGIDVTSLIDRLHELALNQDAQEPTSARSSLEEPRGADAPALTAAYSSRKRVFVLLGIAVIALAFVTLFAPKIFEKNALYGGAPSIDISFPPSPDIDILPWALLLLTIGAAIGVCAAIGIRRHRRRRFDKSAQQIIILQAASRRPEDKSAQQVFVSYSRRNQDVVEQVVGEIQQAGFTVWIDRQSTGSQRYAAPIVHAIKSSNIVALMCSHEAFTSDHVIREIYVAGDYKKPFIAFQIDHSEFPDEVQYFVSGFPRIPIDGINQTQLKSEIARLVRL